MKFHLEIETVLLIHGSHFE